MITKIKSSKTTITIKGILKSVNDGIIIVDDEKTGEMEFDINDLESFIDKEVNFTFTTQKNVKED